MARVTKLGDITSIATPASAPGTIRFSHTLTSEFESLRRTSHPGGRAKERGCTIVADRLGALHLRNVGGLGSTANSFSPDLRVDGAAGFTLLGIFHTHPYEQGMYNGVSFSGGDFSHLSLFGYVLSVVQSGARLFAMLKTARTPCISFTRNAQQNTEIAQRYANGDTFQRASRREAQETASQFGIAYYQGGNGVVTRV